MSTLQPNKSVLGKGLASLLPQAPQEQAGAQLNTSALGRPMVNPGEQPGVNRDRHPGIAVLDINEIRANEFQPRRDFDQGALEELAQSIQNSHLK